MQSIPWEVLLNSLQEGYDTAVDGLTGVYARYCPQLLGSFDDFVADILDGDVYVQGVSDAIVEYAPINESDIQRQWSGQEYYLNYQYVFHMRCPRCGSNIIRYLKSDSTLCTQPTAMEFDGVRASPYIRDVAYNGCVGAAFLPVYGTQTDSCGQVVNYPCRISNSYGDDSKLAANVPVFSNREYLYNYFRTGTGYENAVNYGVSFDDTICDGELPFFYTAWQQELWERVINAPDIITIGSYGHGVLDDNWGDDIPWIALDYLQEYSISLLDIYRQIIDDVINGTYMSDRGVPKTYSDAWDAAITDAWGHVVKPAEPDLGTDDKDRPIESENLEKDTPSDGDNDNVSKEQDPLNSSKWLDEMSPEELSKLTPEQLKESLPEGWKYNQSPDGKFIHIRDVSGNYRIRIDPPDSITPYDHMHIYDQDGNSLDINGNIVPYDSPNAHIPRQ